MVQIGILRHQSSMDSLLHFVRWLKGLDYADLLLYVGLPTLVLLLAVDWLKEVFRPWR